MEQIPVAPRREVVVNMFVSLDGFTGGGQDWGIRAQPGPQLQAYGWPWPAARRTRGGSGACAGHARS
jgi:hypothetical protein